MKIVTILYITGKSYFLKQPFLRIKTQTQFKNTNYLSITKKYHIRSDASDITNNFGQKKRETIFANRLSPQPKLVYIKITISLLISNPKIFLLFLLSLDQLVGD